MNKYLIYLKSQDTYDRYGRNVYGYYLGKTYQVDYEKFPVTTMDENTAIIEGKFYKSKKTAKLAAEKLMEKCIYVRSYEIIEYKLQETQAGMED